MVTKSIRVYKDYEVRILEVQNVRVGGAVGSFRRVNRDVEG